LLFSNAYFLTTKYWWFGFFK